MANEKYKFSEIVRYALDIGEMTHICGGEVSRVEEMISRVCYAYGAKRVDVLTITSVTILTVISPDGEPITQIRRIKAQTRDMTKLDALNKLSREVCSTCPDPDYIHERLHEIKKMRSLPWYLRLIASLTVAAFFTSFFGGSWKDFIATLPVAAVIFALEHASKKININKIVNYLIISFAAGAVSVLTIHIGIGENVNAIMIGAIMLLIPGVSMTGAFEDLLSGDTITGLLSLCESMLVAISIAVGFAVATYAFGGYNMLSNRTPTPSHEIQLITATLSALGYSMVCGFRKPKRILFGAIGGGLCQLTYILMSFCELDEAICIIIATIVAGTYAQILARVLKTPATVFVLPAVIPLIPGRALYYTMSWALRGDFNKFSSWGIDTIIWAFSIAFGIITVIVVASVLKMLIRKIRNKKEKL